MGKKQLNEYANIIFGGKEKKVIDKANNIEDNSSIEVEQVMKNIKKETDVPFNPTLNAYVPYFNRDTKKYEMFTIAIDPKTNRTELFREVKPYDNESRAIMEMQKLYANDLSNRIKQKMSNK